MYTITIIIETKPEHIKRLKSIIIRATELAKEEKDCVRYYSHQKINNHCQYIIYETWLNQSSFLKQTKKPEVIALSEEFKKLLKHPPQVDYFR